MVDVNKLAAVAERWPAAPGAEPPAPIEWEDDANPAVRTGWQIEDLGALGWALERLGELQGAGYAVQTGRLAA